ncbi:Ferric reduction oxidase 8, partial [Globisporangium polare]
MAPASAVLTPNPVGEYAVLKTPEVDNGKPTSGSPRRFGPSKWSAKYWLLGSLAQVLIVASIAVYVYGQIVIMTPFYSNTLSKTIGEWWGVPKVTTKNASKGHSEMTRPTYFFLFTVIP